MTEPASTPTRDETHVPSLERLLAISSVATIAGLLVSIARAKVTASILGPEGVGISAEVQQVISVALVPVSFAAGPALVRAIAGARSEAELRDARTALRTAMAFTVGAGFVAAVGGSLAGWWLFRGESSSVNAWLVLAAISGWLAGPVAVVSSGLIAKSRVRENAVITVAQAALLAVFSMLGTILWGLDGQFLGAAIAAALVVPFARRMLRTSLPALGTGMRGVLAPSFLKTSLVVGLAGLFSAGASQSVWSLLRALVHDVGGAEANGQLQAARTVGVAYFGIVLQALSSVVFPTYAAAKSTEELSRAIDAALGSVLRFAPPLILLAVALRVPIMHALFSEKFDEAAVAVGYQMAADLPKAMVWAITGPLLYRGKVRAFILSEALAWGLLGIAAVFLVPKFGVVGTSYAHVACYLAVAVVDAFIVKRSLQVVFDSRKILVASLGAIAISVIVAVGEVNPIANWVFAAIGAAWCMRIGLGILRERRFGRPVGDAHRRSP